MVLNHSCGDRVRGIKLLRYILERFFHNVTKIHNASLKIEKRGSGLSHESLTSPELLNG